MTTRRDAVVWWLANRDGNPYPTEEDYQRLAVEADDLLEELQDAENHTNPTARELEVLVLFQKGMGSKEIAQTLGRSPNTINAHLVSVRRRYGVKRTYDAIAILTERGLM